jgi:hypothetical protein
MLKYDFKDHIVAHKNKEDLYRSQIFRWRKLKEKAIEYKGGECIKCGYNQHPAALVFHHVNVETKEHSWTTLRLHPWDYIKAELDKCDLLCANCHQIVHSVSKYDPTPTPP